MSDNELYFAFVDLATKIYNAKIATGNVFIADLGSYRFIPKKLTEWNGTLIINADRILPLELVIRRPEALMALLAVTYRDARDIYIDNATK